MSPVPHPALRRLLAAAAMPGRCLESLDAAAPDLAAVARDLEGAALVVDRSLEPLARGIDLAALGRAAAPPDRADGRAPSADRGWAGVRPEEPLPSEPPRRSRRPVSAEPAEARRGPALEHDAAGVAAVLSRFAPAADAGPASRGPISGDAAASGPARRTDATWKSAEAPTRIPRAVSVDTADGVRRLPTREEAAAELRRRTAATAGDGGLDTPVRVDQPTVEVDVLLRESESTEGGRSTTEGGRSAAEGGRAASAARPTSAATQGGSTPGGPTSVIPVGGDAARDDGHLHEVLERVRAVAARRPVAAEGIRPARPEMDPFEGGDGARGNGARENGADGAAADPPRAPKPAAVAAAGGLRGLAQRAEAAGQVLAPRGVTFPSAAAESAAGVVAARADEAELAERIDRLLRREARRQGIDLEGVGP
jgi:hypothetical protein